MGESLNKTKQFEEISARSKNDKYQNIQSIQTLSCEASCVMAGVRPIQLAIEEKVRTYKVTHNIEHVHLWK